MNADARTILQFVDHARNRPIMMDGRPFAHECVCHSRSHALLSRLAQLGAFRNADRTQVTHDLLVAYDDEGRRHIVQVLETDCACAPGVQDSVH